MNIKHYKLLHYVLIILLMFAPLRGVVAAHCDMETMGDMKAMDASSSSTLMPGSAILVHDMSAMQHTSSMPTDSIPSEINKHSCCDDISVNCSGSCDLGVNVSIILQATSYAAVYKISYKSDSLSSKTLFRELTPPSRPPANLHS